jgi:hypothetical protein
MAISMNSTAKISLIFFLFFFSTALPLSATPLTITGKITVDGTPVRGVLVYGSDGAKRGYTDSNGEYSIVVPKTGTYTVSPYLRRLYIPKISSKKVTIDSSSDRAPVNFELESIADGAGVLTGRIFDSGGKPLEGVKVRISKTVFTETDRNGIYRFANKNAGRYFVFPSSDNYTFTGYFRESKLKSGVTMTRSYTAIRKATNDQYTTFATGLWDLSAKITGGNCSLDQKTLSGRSLITQRKNSLFLSLPRLNTFRGTISDRSITLQINAFRSLCRISGTLSGSFQDSNNGKLGGTLKVTCFVAQNNCSAEMTASLDRVI